EIMSASPTPCFLDPGGGQAVWFLRNRITIKATAAATGAAYGRFEPNLAPGFPPPLHAHHPEAKAFWVLRGELTRRRADRTFRAAAGSCVFLPRDMPHTFVVEGDAPARMLTLLTPGGGEGLFVDAGRPAEHDGLPPPGPLDLDRLRRVSEQ